jgi:hypothetical protein
LGRRHSCSTVSHSCTGVNTSKFKVSKLQSSRVRVIQQVRICKWKLEWTSQLMIRLNIVPIRENETKYFRIFLFRLTQVRGLKQTRSNWLQNGTCTYHSWRFWCLCHSCWR